VSLGSEKFLKILRIELEDLQAHLEALETKTDDAMRRGLATEHVVRENCALYENEKCSVRRFINELKTFDAAGYDSPAVLAEAVKKRFAEVQRACDYAGASCVFAERKICKVLRYVTA